MRRASACQGAFVRVWTIVHHICHLVVWRLDSALYAATAWYVFSLLKTHAAWHSLRKIYLFFCPFPQLAIKNCICEYRQQCAAYSFRVVVVDIPSAQCAASASPSQLTFECALIAVMQILTMCTHDLTRDLRANAVSFAIECVCVYVSHINAPYHHNNMPRAAVAIIKYIRAWCEATMITYTSSAL